MYKLLILDDMQGKVILELTDTPTGSFLFCLKVLCEIQTTRGVIKKLVLNFYILIKIWDKEWSAS